MADDVVHAHVETETIRLVRTYPDHAPRQEDPGYKVFERAKARIKAAGKWHCVIANEDCSGPTSLHHDLIEFAYANDVDLGELNKLLGLHLTDDEFVAFINEPGQLEPLCFAHHMGPLAIHRIPAADWTIVRVHKAGVHPVEIVSAPKRATHAPGATPPHATDGGR